MAEIKHQSELPDAVIPQEMKYKKKVTDIGTVYIYRTSQGKIVDLIPHENVPRIMESFRKHPTWLSLVDFGSIAFYSEQLHEIPFFNHLFQQHHTWRKFNENNPNIKTSEVDFVRWCYAMGYGKMLYNQMQMIYSQIKSSYQ